MSWLALAVMPGTILERIRALSSSQRLENAAHAGEAEEGNHLPATMTLEVTSAQAEQ